MARLLTGIEIFNLASRKGAKRVAVENFLSSLDNSMPSQFHLANLQRDGLVYHWNAATRNAVKAGILLAYREELV